MKWKELKDIVDKLTEEELQQDIIYSCEDLCLSGTIHEVKKAEENLYYTGEDDPSELYTKEELVNMGYDEEDVENSDIEIPKGSIYLNF